MEQVIIQDPTVMECLSDRNTNYRNDEDGVTSSTDCDTVTSSMDSFISGDTDSEVTSTSN